MTSHSIDTSQLKGFLNEEMQVKGKIINVVNQIPYNCLINNQQQTEGDEPINNNDIVNNKAPISNLQRRRSTVNPLGQTNIWHLSNRRGHSAMYAALDSLKKDYRTLYIGGTGSIMSNDSKKTTVPMKSLSPEEKYSLKHLLNDKYDMVPIFVDDKSSFGHYEGYSKQVLWPLLHYLMWSDNVDEVSFWRDYVQVNQLFADQVIEQYEEGDIIWVHDYHLMLLPQMIRTVLPNARIGLFIHTPFPSSEIFRCLPHRKEVLLGVLGANIIGFQTYNYARHFASNCTRILGYELTPSGILGNGLLTQIGIYPIGIDVERTRSHCSRPGVSLKAKAMREKYGNKAIIVGRDKLDPVKGVLQKLEAFEIFLSEYPEWRDKVVLIQVTSPGVLSSPELEKKTAELVARINGKYGSIEFTPVNFFNQHIDRDEYYALMQVADIGLVTPVIGGMNTSSFEYIVAQEQRHSPLILSEFTGTASSLGAAVIVNPWDFSEVARAIAECLCMSEEERQIKYKQLHQFVTSHTAAYWAKSLIKGLMTTPKDFLGNTVPLDITRVKAQYGERKKRALFFDYDGTLVPICNNPQDAKPTQKVLDILTRLCKDPNNIVWVISGRPKDNLEQWLGHIPQLGLSSEHGCFLKDPGSKTWISMLETIDMGWKEDVKEIFEYYTERTPGSFIEEKEYSLTWHYRKADQKYGAFQAKEMQNHLEQNVVGKLSVECLASKKAVEVRPSLINKGIIIKRTITQHPMVEFILCAGDDKSDEDMFRILERMELGGAELIQFTIFVGSMEGTVTLANWKVDSTQDFVNLLNNLA